MIQDASPDTRWKTLYSWDFLAQITKTFETEKQKEKDRYQNMTQLIQSNEQKQNNKHCFADYFITKKKNFQTKIISP